MSKIIFVILCLTLCPPGNVLHFVKNYFQSYFVLHFEWKEKNELEYISQCKTMLCLTLEYGKEKGRRLSPPPFYVSSLHKFHPWNEKCALWYASTGWNWSAVKLKKPPVHCHLFGFTNGKGFSNFLSSPIWNRKTPFVSNRLVCLYYWLSCFEFYFHKGYRIIQSD